MKRIIGNVVFAIYAIIAVLVTICLLSYNDYKVSEFGNSTLIIIDSNEVEPYFKKGDIAILNKKDKIETGDKILFYNKELNKVEITLGEVTNMEKSNTLNTIYTINGDTQISSKYLIGPIDSASRISKIGTILGILESKWGFLFLIVFPSLIAFIYEIYIVVAEIKENKKVETKE